MSQETNEKEKGNSPAVTKSILALAPVKRDQYAKSSHIGLCTTLHAPVVVVARTINAISERRIKEVTQRCPASRVRTRVGRWGKRKAIQIPRSQMP